MKLNADIVFESLKSHYDAELFGLSEKELHLMRPTFYMAPETKFAANRLYVASADHLPAHPSIEKGTVIVCLGDSLQLSYYLRKCAVIQIKGKQDIFAVYLAIQEVFDRYDAWNDELFELFKDEADTQKIVSCSTSVIEEPIIVVDSEFKFVATAARNEDDFSELWKDGSQRLSQYAIDHFLSAAELRTTEREPMFLKIVDANALCVNLFDAAERYIGCLCLLVFEGEPRQGLDAVARYLARIIERSIEKNPALLATERNARKGLLQDLLDGLPIGPNQRWLLKSDDNAAFLCISLHTYGNRQPLPQRFIASSLEMAFPGSYAMIADDMVVGVVDLAAIGCAAGAYRARTAETLAALTQSLQLCAGVSNDFSDLRNVPLYYKQAVAAFESGSLIDPQKTCFYFMDYVLMELAINAFAGAPIETFFPYEFRQLLEHDRKSSVSFLETLKVVLAENMNFSRAAEALFVHRSTLIDRVERIQSKFGLDLHDADTRLLLQLLLKGLDAEQGIRSLRP